MLFFEVADSPKTRRLVGQDHLQFTPYNGKLLIRLGQGKGDLRYAVPSFIEQIGPCRLLIDLALVRPEQHRNAMLLDDVKRACATKCKVGWVGYELQMALVTSGRLCTLVGTHCAQTLVTVRESGGEFVVDLEQKPCEISVLDEWVRRCVNGIPEPKGATSTSPAARKPKKPETPEQRAQRQAKHERAKLEDRAPGQKDNGRGRRRR